MAEPDDAVFEVKKVHLLSDDGQPAHVRAKKLILTRQELWIGRKGKEDIRLPLEAIIDTDRSRNRVAINHAAEGEEAAGFAFAVSGFGASRKAEDLKSQLDKCRSVRLLELKREKLAKEGRAAEIAVVECRFCGTPIDMTNFPNAAQVHCEFCKSIFSVDKPPPDDIEKNHYFCEGCGYYSHIQEYSTLKLLFLIYYAQWSLHREKLCPTCARARARNRAIYCFFLSTIALVWSVPYNLLTYFKALRAHKTVPDPLFARLDGANRLARKGRFGEAQAIYLEIAKESLAHMGVVTNMGTVLYEQGQVGGAISAVEKAIGLCPNYIGNHLLLAALHRDAGNDAKADEIEERAKKLWEMDDAPAAAEEPAPPSASPTE